MDISTATGLLGDAGTAAAAVGAATRAVLGTALAFRMVRRAFS